MPRGMKRQSRPRGMKRQSRPRGMKRQSSTSSVGGVRLSEKPLQRSKPKPRTKEEFRKDYMDNIGDVQKRAKMTKAAKLIQKNVRASNYRKGPIRAMKQLKRDIKREADTMQKRIQTDAGYRKQVISKAANTVGQSAAKGLGSSAMKFGGGVGATILAQQLWDKVKPSKKEEE